MSLTQPCTAVGGGCGAGGMAGCTWGVVRTRAGEEGCLDKGNRDLLGPLPLTRSEEVREVEQWTKEPEFGLGSWFPKDHWP